MTTSRIEAVAAHRARILNAIPAELHNRAKANAWTLTNIRGGIPSDNLADAVSELAEMQAAGSLDQATSSEAYAARERASR